MGNRSLSMTQRPRKVKWVLPKGATQFGALAVIFID